MGNSICFCPGTGRPRASALCKAAPTAGGALCAIGLPLCTFSNSWYAASCSACRRAASSRRWAAADSRAFCSLAAISCADLFCCAARSASSVLSAPANGYSVAPRPRSCASSWRNRFTRSAVSILSSIVSCCGAVGCAADSTVASANTGDFNNRARFIPWLLPRAVTIGFFRYWVIVAATSSRCAGSVKSLPTIEGVVLDPRMSADARGTPILVKNSAVSVVGARGGSGACA